MPTPAERRMIGRLGGLTRAALSDGHEMTANATAAFRTKWEREVDPDGILDPIERDRRAQAALRAHMTRLSLRSSQVRARKQRRITESKGE